MEENFSYALRPGTVLQGNQTYIIRRVLGAGGFGITYLAETTFVVGNIEINAYVAVKEHFIKDYCSRGGNATSVLIPPTGNLVKQVADARRDFLSEARRLAQVGAGHANIVKVNEVFEANGTAYYVMEYLDGASLWYNIQANGPMDEASLRAVLTPIVEAVAYLHAGKLTHLDIKPANIMLTVRKDGSVRPVLIDFGLSKHYDEHGNATSTINTLGASDGYAPMEQYMGIRTFSPTADVYSLGATMLACLSGNTPPRASEWQPGQIEATVAHLPISDTLKAVIVKAMQPHPSARYPDAGAMLTALGGVPTPAPMPQPRPIVESTTRKLEEPAAPKKSKPKGLIAVAAVLAAIIVIGVFTLRNDEKIASVGEASASVDNTKIAEITAADSTPMVGMHPGASSPEPEQTSSPQPAPTPSPQPAPTPTTTVGMHPGASTPATNVTAEDPAPIETYGDAYWNARRTPHHLDLAVSRNGRQYYLSRSDYNAMDAATRNSLNKLGVVVIGTGNQFHTTERFILGLEDIDTDINWHDAVTRYRTQMPSKEQGDVWASHLDEIGEAIRAFGGNHSRKGYGFWYWTKDEWEYDSHAAYYIYFGHGDVGYQGKTFTERVRLIEDLSAM